MKELTNDQKLVMDIIEYAGGKDNVANASNCMTRLRLQIRDDSKVQTEALKSLDGVMGLVNDRANNLEVVLGPGKCKKCADICREMGLISDDKTGASEDWKENKAKIKGAQKTGKTKAFLKSIGDIFVPLIPGIIVAGLCAGFAMLISQLVPDYADSKGWNLVYQLLSLLNTAFMTYITAWAGYRAAERFGATPILGGMLGMVTGLEGINKISIILGLWNEASELSSVLRSGRGGVIAVILGVWVMSKVEKAVRKRMPESLDVVFTPFVTLIVCIIPYILLIMPGMGYVSDAICWLVEKGCMSDNLFVAGIVGFIATAFFLPLVAMGMHHGLIAIYSVQLLAQGYVTLYPSLAMAGAGQVGAAIALYIRAKRAKNKYLCKVISGALPAGVLGIGEPLIYGVTLPLGKPFITAGIGAGFGGAFVMINHVAATTWGPSGILGFFVMTAGPNSPVTTMLYYGIGLVISCVLGGVITYLATKPKDIEPDNTQKEIAEVPARVLEADIQGVRVSHGDSVMFTATSNSFTYVIKDAVGIHARPAGALVKLVKEFNSEVTITANDKKVSATGVIDIMSLGIKQGTEVKIEALGEDSEAALVAVSRFLKENL